LQLGYRQDCNDGQGELRSPSNPVFCLLQLGYRQDCNDGQGELRSPSNPVFCLLQLGYRQDCNDGQGGAPLRLLPHPLQLRFSYCNLAVAKISMMGMGSTASLAPPPTTATFCLLQLGYRQDCNDGQGEHRFACSHPLQLRFSYCSLAIAKIAMMGRGSTASLAPPPTTATFCLLQLGCRQDCNDGHGEHRFACSPTHYSYVFPIATWLSPRLQ
jgi:hypothetical protein